MKWGNDFVTEQVDFWNRMDDQMIRPGNFRVVEKDDTGNAARFVGDREKL